MNEYQVKLCSKMMAHAAFDPNCNDLRVSEVRELLRNFFTDEVIEKAAKVWLGGSTYQGESPALD